jgi:hypothetical protein
MEEKSSNEGAAGLNRLNPEAKSALPRNRFCAPAAWPRAAKTRLIRLRSPEPVWEAAAQSIAATAANPKFTSIAQAVRLNCIAFRKLQA